MPILKYYNKYNTRNSPNVSAQDYPNKIKQGNDKVLYISKADKNNIYKWVKLKEIYDCKSAEEYYFQFPENKIKDFNIKKQNLMKILNLLSKLLIKNNIFFIYTGWSGVYNFVDNSWSKAENIISKKLKISSTEVLDRIQFIIYSDFNLYSAIKNNTLYLQQNISRQKDYIDYIFKSIFGRSYNFKSLKNTINIKLNYDNVKIINKINIHLKGKPKGSPAEIGYLAKDFKEQSSLLMIGKDYKIWEIKNKKWIISDFYKNFIHSLSYLKKLLKKSPVKFSVKYYDDKIEISYNNNSIGQILGKIEWMRLACQSKFYKYVYEDGFDILYKNNKPKIITYYYKLSINEWKDFDQQCKKYNIEIIKFIRANKKKWYNQHTKIKNYIEDHYKI